MKGRTSLFIAVSVVAQTAIFSTAANRNPVHAQEGVPALQRAPHCTNGTASGTYGYHLAGQAVGANSFLVNGLFTHHSDDAMDHELQRPAQ